MTQQPCTYPVISKFASMAEPLKCRKPGGITANVPYVHQDGSMQTITQSVCLPHACEVASWRLIQNLPTHQFSREEFEFLVAIGGHRRLLALELKALGQFEPDEKDTEENG